MILKGTALKQHAICVDLCNEHVERDYGIKGGHKITSILASKKELLRDLITKQYRFVWRVNELQPPTVSNVTLMVID